MGPNLAHWIEGDPPLRHRVPHARLLGWSRVGDFIWRELHAGKTPAEVKRALSEYVDELEARRDR